MEQVFIIIAVLVFWIFKGVAGAQRRVPGQDPYESDPLSPDAPRDVVGATRQQTLEGQQRAIEALQRWEEEQGLSAGERDPARSASADLVPAASRTRLGRPAMTSGPTAARHRKEAFADIARMLDPGQPAGRTAAKRSGFQVSLPATPSPGEEAARTARPVADRRPSDAAVRRDAAREEEAAHKEADAQESAAAQRAAAAGRVDKPSTSSVLARIESLPFAARAIVYSEILGHPRSLS